MADYSEQFLQETIKVWQRHSPEPLTLEDAREIADNMAELFVYLNDLNQRYEPKEEKI